MYHKKANIICVVGLFSFLITTILLSSMWVYSLSPSFKIILKLVRYISYLICIGKIVIDKFEFDDCIKIFLFCIIAIICGIQAKSMLLPLYCIVFLSVYGIDKKTIIKITLITQMISWSFIVITSQIGLNIDVIFGIGDRNRHGLGFSWTTTAPILFLFMVLEYIYLKSRKITFTEMLVAETINLGLFLLTDARMTFLICSLSIVLFWIFPNFNFIRKMKLLFVTSPVYIALFALFIHICYNPQKRVWYELNNLLSGRLKLGHSAIEKYGIKVFGQKIEWIGYNYNAKSGVYNYVDCSYLQILLEFGLAFLIILLLLYSWIMYNALKEREYYLCVCLFIVLVFSITEPRLLNLMYNPFPLLAVSYLKTSKISFLKSARDKEQRSGNEKTKVIKS